MKTLAKARVLVTRFPFESRHGGEEVHTINLMKGLRERGHEVFFLGSCEIFLSEFEREGFEVKRAFFLKPPVTKLWLAIFSILSPLLFVYGGFLILKARITWRVDTLYCLSLGEKLLISPWALLSGMKVIWVEHARIGRWLSANPWRPLYSLLSRFVSVVVTSNAMKRFLPFARNVKAISCGVFLEKAEALPNEIGEFLASMNSNKVANNKSFVIGVVARLTPDKGMDMIDKLVRSQPDILLIVIGEGPYKFQQRERLLIVPNLNRGQLTTFYKKLDLFILPSTEFDPFGMVAAEAMMAGTPAVVTDKCGIAFDLKNGREAFVIPAKFKELDLIIKRLKKNPILLKKIALSGQKFAIKNYTLQRMVDEFELLGM